MIRATFRWAAAATLVLVVGTAIALVAEDAPPALVERTVKSLGKLKEGAGEPMINSIGSRMAYVLYREKKQVLVCDGREGREYLGISGLHFSPDGGRLAYLAQNTLSGSTFVCDGVEIRGHGMYPFTFSPDGRHTVYRSDATMRDGRPEGDCPMTGKAFAFSPDSRRLAYVTYSCIICDGKKGPEVEKGGVLGDPVWAPDSRSYAHTVSQGDKIGDRWVVFWADKKVGGPYDMVEGIVFAPDSKRIVYRALAKDKWSVVVNDKKGPGFSNIGTIVFSGDNKHMAYRACDDDGWFVVCDGKKGPAYTDVGDPVFSADGKHMAYRAVKDGKALVICDDRETASFDEITWVGFAQNGNHLAFAAGRGNNKFVVCDGVEGPPHERLMVPERPFEVVAKLRYVVIEKAEASLLEVDWPADRIWENAFSPSAK